LIAGLAALAALLAACATTPPKPPKDAFVPDFAKLPYEPFSRDAAIAIAFREWRLFGAPVLPETATDDSASDAALYPDQKLERAEGLWQRVGEYWWLGLDAGDPERAWTGKHDAHGQVFPPDEDARFAWSAAFISYVMRLAGAGASFPYSETHADYIDAAARRDPGIALEAHRVQDYAPQRGDLICLWRGRRQVTFEELPTSRFAGHCDIVVDIKAGRLDVIGGNVDNAVAMKHIPATADGRLAGPDGIVVDPDHHWFVVLKVLYKRDGSAPPAAISAVPQALSSSG
jgi:Uncharacterized protein conserved in bacteria (DUF2272)